MPAVGAEELVCAVNDQISAGVEKPAQVVLGRGVDEEQGGQVFCNGLAGRTTAGIGR